jgi:AAA ATPase domain
MIGRAGERSELERRLRERMSTMLAGPRRSGKTTVCEAACKTLTDDGFILLQVEVPERADSRAFLQLMIDRAARISLADQAGAIGRTIRPMVEKFLGEQGVPLDLSALEAAPGTAETRSILSLPFALAAERRKPTILFLDELQRAVSYADGDVILSDLVDLYGRSDDVVVLVDGSNERALEGMLGEPSPKRSVNACSSGAAARCTRQWPQRAIPR